MRPGAGRFVCPADAAELRPSARGRARRQGQGISGLSLREPLVVSPFSGLDGAGYLKKFSRACKVVKGWGGQPGI
jgi:hypothetical protein